MRNELDGEEMADCLPQALQYDHHVRAAAQCFFCCHFTPTEIKGGYR